MSAFSFVDDPQGGYRLDGELGYHSLAGPAPPLPALGDGPVTVSLAGLTRIDSAGIAQLIAWRAEAQARNADLRYTCAPEQLLQMVDAYGIQSLFDGDAAEQAGS